MLEKTAIDRENTTEIIGLQKIKMIKFFIDDKRTNIEKIKYYRLNARERTIFAKYTNLCKIAK